MGAYLCIASNTVPPTVSKRIKVSVDCEYINSLSIVFYNENYRFTKSAAGDKADFILLWLFYAILRGDIDGN